MSSIRGELLRIRSGKPHIDRDEGSALILILVLVIIVITTLIVTPLLGYGVAVTRASRLVDTKAQRLDAVKGGLRTALVDPTALYKACNSTYAGINLNPTPASPLLTIPVQTTCAQMGVNYSEDVTRRPYGVVAVQAGVALLAAYTPSALNIHSVYPGSGQIDATIWRTTNTNPARVQDTIWTPNLPVHALSPRSATPYAMPATFPACQVYVPGTYVDPITISGSTPVFFTSGVYYFENSATVSGNANVVVGGGGVDGRTADQFAAFCAVNAPSTHNITGLGSTLVFGMGGRLIVNNSVPFTGAPGTSMSLVFNQRYVDPTDTNTLPGATVNIMSVNGELLNSDLTNPLTDLVRPGVLSVAYSVAPDSATTFGKATLNKYRPSTLVPPASLGVDSLPIIDINLTAATPTTMTVPGYVDVPQGRVSIAIGAGMGTNDAINFNGGIIARTIEIPGASPAAFTIGVSQVVTQLILRIKSWTTSGLPVVTSDAMLQVNANGAYAVNSCAVGEAAYNFRGSTLDDGIQLIPSTFNAFSRRNLGHT